MGKAAPDSELLSDGLTLAQVAAELTHRLGREVTPQQVHYLAKRRGAAPVGRTVVSVRRVVEVDAISPEHLDQLETAARAALTVPLQ